MASRKKKSARKTTTSRKAPRRRSSPSARKRYRFAALQKSGRLQEGAQGQDVRVLQSLLSQMGYLGRDRQPGTMCKCTCAALRSLQKLYGLKDSGEADRETLQFLERPRCGVPDIGPDPTRSSGPAPFVLRGCNYDRAELTYAFINGTPDLGGQLEREIVREAFGAWSSVTPLRFTEVGDQNPHDFPISWQQGNHGDGSPFDGQGTATGNTLAHAFYPPPCGGAFSGALHFDEDESWTDQASPGRIRLLNVAIHEIGHLLGLDHSDQQDAIMFAFYDDNVDSLRPDDVNGAQALYGAPASGIAPIRGRLERATDRAVHRIRVDRPGVVRAVLSGPASADFDLYMRAGLEPSRRVFDARGFTSSSEEEIALNVTGGDVFIVADSWRGSGAYEIRVSIEAL